MASLGFSQVIFFAEQPASVEGDYEVSYAVASSGWGVADLNNPVNAVQDTLIFADDSLACTPLVNGADISGHIAVIYRGDCEFGAKAYAAQNAGAIAVVIINNVSGATISMGGGVDGPNVTIPVVMITQQTGALLRAQYDAGEDVLAFIGSKSGFYNNDLGLAFSKSLRPEEGSRPSLITMDNNDYTHQVGAWITNYGSDPQTNINLTCKVVNNGTEVYNNSGTPVASLNPGDSLYFALPDFSLTSYPTGLYEMEYTISNTEVDEFNSDDSLSTNFYIGDEYSYALGQTPDGAPIATTYIRPTDSDNYSTCMHIRDANASRAAIQGVYFSATMGTDANGDDIEITGQYVEAKVYEWNDVFTDIDDPNFNISNISTVVAEGSYSYIADDQEVNKFIHFNEATVLNDNQRYLVCVDFYSPDIYAGYNTELDYSRNSDSIKQPLFPIQDDQGQFFINGFGLDYAPAIGLHFIEAGAVSIDEVTEEIKVGAPYPNPANKNVTIPMGNVNVDNGTLTIHSIDGKIVKEQTISFSNTLNVNVSDLANGRYIFKLNNNNEIKTFNVVISK